MRLTGYRGIGASRHRRLPLTTVLAPLSPLPQDKSHTILLVQPDKDKYSRIYFDFDTLGDALSGECAHVVAAPSPPLCCIRRRTANPCSPFSHTTGVSQLFENKLREINPGRDEITYNLQDLFGYLDALPDVSVLVQDPKQRVYVPYGLIFIKNNIFARIQEQQSGRR